MYALCACVWWYTFPSVYLWQSEIETGCLPLWHCNLYFWDLVCHRSWGSYFESTWCVFSYTTGLQAQASIITLNMSVRNVKASLHSHIASILFMEASPYYKTFYINLLMTIKAIRVLKSRLRKTSLFLIRDLTWHSCKCRYQAHYNLVRKTSHVLH